VTQGKNRLFAGTLIKTFALTAILLGVLAPEAIAITETKTVTQLPSLIVPANPNRYEATAQLVVTTPATTVTCSQVDSNVVTGQIRLNSAAATTLQSTMPLWCFSQSAGGASFTFVYSTVSPFSTSEIKSNIGAASILISPGNYSNRKSVFIGSCSADAVACGYTCPATASNGIELAAGTAAACGQTGFKFEGGTDICCFGTATADIIVVTERSAVND
jgi:hypothetical protein